MAAPANRGRKAAPTRLKLIKGDGKGRDSAGREIPAEIPFIREPPPKPEFLSKDAEWLWDQIVEQMNGIGLLKPLDAASLEVVCETFARWRDAVRQRNLHGAIGKNSQGIVAAPWVGIEERASKEFRAWCAEYGLTPAAEKNLVSGDKDAPGQDNPFA